MTLIIPYNILKYGLIFGTKIVDFLADLEYPSGASCEDPLLRAFRRAG